MTTPDQPLRCGVLIIGSLFWHADKDGRRENWRASRLDLPAKQVVSAPIRYGRRSGTWGNAFTMILDSNTADGQGLLVPCKAQICSFDQLVEEVEWLWAAEANAARSNKFHKMWGCVGAHFGQNSIAAGIHDEWKIYFETAKPFSLPAISSDGKLNAPWPRAQQDEPVSHFDIILGTATMPDPADERPSPHEIAEGWVKQDKGYERYFFENVRHGIRTQDDLEIWTAINKQSPPWLTCEKYKPGIDILRSELRLSQERAGSSGDSILN
jgi:hypothetical protein